MDPTFHLVQNVTMLDHERKDLDITTKSSIKYLHVSVSEELVHNSYYKTLKITVLIKVSLDEIVYRENKNKYS